MTPPKKNYKELIILNIYLLLIYFIVLFNLKTGISEFIMFSTVDAKRYAEVGNWIFENTPTNETYNNPFLYPLISRLLMLSTGVYGVWFVQFLLWLLSVNLLFLSLKRLTNKRLAFAGAVIFSLNFSYIALTLHALTDVSVTFITCWMIYYLSDKIPDFRKWNIFCTVVFTFSILTVIKPVFFPLLVFLLVILFPLFYLREFMKSSKKYLLIIVLLPVIFQMSLMYYKHNIVSISAKGSSTFKDYFFAQSYAKLNNLTIEEAMDSVQNLSQDYMYDFMLENKKLVAENYVENILFENITGNANFLDYPPGYRNKFFYYMMELENNFFLLLHFLFLIPCIYFIYYLKKNNSVMLTYYTFFLLMFYYLVLISGIAFWQGDRYTVSFQPLWIMIYLSVVYNLFVLRKSSRKIISAEK